MTDLPALSARLAAATGADADIDEAIALWQHPWLRDLPRTDVGGWIHPQHGPVWPAERYTDDTDTALALLKAQLPGWWVTIRDPWSHDSDEKRVNLESREAPWIANGRGPTIPLAALRAMFAALIAKEAPDAQ